MAACFDKGPIYLCAVEGLMYLAPACTFWLAIGVGLLEYRCRLRELRLGSSWA
jgi:hypothetical protein